MIRNRIIFTVLIVTVMVLLGAQAYAEDCVSNIESIKMIDSHRALVVFKAPISKEQKLYLMPLEGSLAEGDLTTKDLVGTCSAIFDLCKVPPAKYYFSGEKGKAGIARAIRYSVNFIRIDCLKPNNILLNGTLKARVSGTYNGMLQQCQELAFDRCGSADCNGIVSYSTDPSNCLKITASSAFPVSTLVVGADLFWNESAFAKSRHTFLGGLANKLVKTGLAAASEITALLVKNDAAKTNYAVAGVLIQGFSDLVTTEIPTVRLGSGSRPDIINEQTCSQFFDCDRTMLIKNRLGDCTLHYTVKMTVEEI